MARLDPWYEARRRMVDAVVADLYGSSDDDVLTEAPLERFVVGILHPRSPEGLQESVELADEPPEVEVGAAPDADYDPAVSFAHLRYPSTMGVTLGVTTSTQTLDVEVEADRYEQETDERAETNPDGVGTRASNRRAGRWKRVAAGPVAIPVDLAAPGHRQLSVADGLALSVVVREPRDGVANVTLVLVNTLRRPQKAAADAFCWFRPVLRVRARDGEFADRRPSRSSAHMDADERSGELLYRAQRHLAVGHGVAVTWQEGRHVTELETTFFPEHELRLAQADRGDVGGLEMAALAEEGVTEPLVRLVDRYESWIEDQERAISALDVAHVETARAHLSEARVAVGRMRRGIELLGRDPVVDRAFRIMNAVMREQRYRQELLRAGKPIPKESVVGAWRPFQMAFLLLNLEGLADPRSADRDVADLLWFPTGGGKTEAYLGLIAFALVHRRLRRAGEDHDGAGVGVIMRYTLRLLTLQQFERASGLVCALESLRRSSPDLKDVAPFSIGLWVGMGATPNTAENAAKALKKKAQDQDPGELGDPVQLLRCPWCGTRLGVKDYQVSGDRLVVRCPDFGCEFRSGLPVHLIDDDVYRERPSLVIGTVDKFAMLAWREKSGRIFGSGHDATPDLIVQDELHLISGPLGTLVGLYETAIDHLATDRETGARPKLVASTATIRRAAGQVAAVFARESKQFPPPGIDASDSFFAVDADPDVKGTRKYVGLMAPSTSHATLLVRTYAALLQGAADLDAPDDVKDAYWTILGYFNSLRVLGAAYIQSIDDVRDRIKVVASRVGSTARPTRDPRELTSRKNAGEIPEELEALQTSYPDPASPDVVLATNMISVGVDVDRLGLMAVMGQPQTTSEYIQATSRVGRKYPGLVFTLYNASRSRDLSHYEGFTSYHRALYRQVEATSATPFAPRALDRGLHGLLVILARHTIPGAAADKSVSVPVDSDRLDDVIEVIAARARSVSPETEAEVRESLRELVEEWREAVKAGAVIQYPRWTMQSADTKALMVPAGAPGKDPKTGEPISEVFPPHEAPWPTLTSLRNVDRESTLRIISTKKTKEVAGGDY